MKVFAKLYIRKIIDIVTLGMQNEGCRKYSGFPDSNLQNTAFRGFLKFDKG